MTTESTSDPVVYTPAASSLVGTGAVLLRALSHWWIAFAASAIFVVSGHLLIKAGLNSLTPLPVNTTVITRVLHSAWHPTVIAGLLIYSMGTVCWMRAVSQKEISFLYPLSSVNFVLIAAASMLFLREDLSTRRMAGVACVVLGMILMNIRSDGEQS